MELNSNDSQTTLKNETTTENSPLVEIKRTFRAPIESVWKAWSDPAVIQKWWGPRDFTSPSVKTDFEVGGKYIFAMQYPNGGAINWSTGTYEQIVPQRKIIYTDQFSDENGKTITPKEAGMPQWEGAGMTCVTVEFESQGDRTIMSLSHEGIPKAMHDDCVSGWNSSIDKMQMLVEEAHTH